MSPLGPRVARTDGPVFEIISQGINACCKCARCGARYCYDCIDMDEPCRWRFVSTHPVSFVSTQVPEGRPSRGRKPPDQDFAIALSPGGATDTEISFILGAPPGLCGHSNQSPRAFAPGFIRSPLRGCTLWMTCVDTNDAGSVEASDSNRGSGADVAGGSARRSTLKTAFGR